MTVSNEVTKAQFQGTGALSAYTYPGNIYDVDDLVVVTTVIATGVESTQTRGGSGMYDYDIVIARNFKSAVVTLNSNLPDTHRLTITPEPEIKQTVNYTENDDFPAETHEQALDKLVVMMHRLKSVTDRIIKLGRGSVINPEVSGDPVSGQALYYNGTSLGWATPSELDTLINVTSFGESLLDDNNATEALDTLGLGHIDLDATLSIFSVGNAENPWSGDQSTDTSWMNGIWFTDRLYWDDTYKMLSRNEDDKDDDIMGWCILNQFPGETIGGVALFRIQGTDSMLDRNGGDYDPPNGYPDRLIRPEFGLIGGWEMQQRWLNNGSSAMSGNGVRIDGADSVPYARVMHGKIDGKHYSGFAVNAFIDFSGTDRAVKPSYFTGFRWDEDGEDAREWVQLYEPPQDEAADEAAPGSNAVVWQTKAALPVETGEAGRTFQASCGFRARARHTPFSGEVGYLSNTTAQVLIGSWVDHGLSVGDYVTISGAQQPEYNGAWPVVRVVDPSNIRIRLDTTPSITPATGTIHIDAVIVSHATGIDRIKNDAAHGQGWCEIHFTDAFQDADAFTEFFDCETNETGDGRMIRNRTRTDRSIRFRYMRDNGNAIALTDAERINFAATGTRA